MNSISLKAASGLAAPRGTDQIWNADAVRWPGHGMSAVASFGVMSGFSWRAKPIIHEPSNRTATFPCHHIWR